MKKTALSILTLAALTVPAAAQAADKYTFDKAHTQIIFSVNHLGFSESHGKFLDYDGSFTFDQAKPENSSVEVTIKTASIEMNDQAWNDHLKNADFFNVEKFPDMTFKSTAIKVTDEDSAEITGDLTLLGVTKPVTMTVDYNKSDTHPYSGKYVSGFSAEAKIKRSDFGMTYGLPGVGDEVEIEIEVEGIREDAAAKTE